MVQWSRELLINNIYYLVDKQKLTLKDVERRSGVTAGYLNRMRKGSEKISTEFFIKAADLLKVSLDVIASVDLKQTNDQDLFIQNYIMKLICTTDDKNWQLKCPHWEQIIDDYGTPHSPIPFQELPAPFFTIVEDNNLEEEMITFKSSYHPSEICNVVNGIYTLDITDESYLAIASLYYSEENEIELYLVTNKSLKALANSQNQSFVSEKLKQLYNNIEDKLQPSKITRNDIKLLNSIF